jgi:hypothetical protein
MKALLFSTLLLASAVAYAQQSHIIKLKSLSGNTIRISFKERFASIEVKNESLVNEAFLELKELMSQVSETHFLCRIYPLYVITPENKYFTYPLNRQRLIKRAVKSEKLLASTN